MWLFTPLGFYSVVNNAMPGKKGVLIRARNRYHLERLCYNLEFNHLRIKETPLNDYRFRIEATFKEFKRVMNILAEMPMDYTNFKGECSEQAGYGLLDSAYVSALSKVWHTMYDYQHNNPEYKGK